jgi:glycosyltransferase involved in cell wall biosynthesis
MIKASANNVSDMCKCALVVPVKNEAKTVTALLNSVSAQSYQPEEVLFVDGGSVDGTVIRLREAGQSDDRIQVIEAGEATPGRGRNIGIAAAKCDWIALTDAGIKLESRWLEKLVEVVERDPDVDVVYGNYEPVTDTFFEACAALAYPAPKRLRNGRLIRGPFIASSLIRRKVWEAAGGFPDLRAAEDLIFMRRVEEMGFKVGWAPDATVRWQLQPDLASTFGKFVLYSRQNVWAGMQRYWHYGLARQYAAWTVFVFLALIHSQWWMLIPVLGTMARVAKSIWVRRETKGILWTLNPLQFAGVAIILLTIDLATFIGWWQAKAYSERPFANQGAEGK